MGTIHSGTAVVAAAGALARFGMTTLLGTHLGCVRTLEAGSLAVLTTRLDEVDTPDVVTIDPDLPGLADFGGFRAVRLRYPRFRLVAVGPSPSREAVLGAIDAGLNGYVPNDLPLSEMVQAFRQLRDGALYIPAMMTDLPVSAAPARPAEPALADPTGLTDRQRDVLKLLVEGKSNKEIGRTLDISESTVKVHVTAAFRRLGVRSRIAAVALMQRARSTAAAGEPELPGIGHGRRRATDWGPVHRLRLAH